VFNFVNCVIQVLAMNNTKIHESFSICEFDLELRGEKNLWVNNGIRTHLQMRGGKCLELVI
jgi:hypothetical protein